VDEKEAIARLQQGDLEGLHFLVERFQALAVHSAYLIVGDMPLAEDIAQAAFLKAARKVDQFDSRRPFRPWFMKIVVNDSIKAAKRQRKSVSLDGPEDEALTAWLLDESPRPEELVEAHELHQRVWTALQRLPAEQRAVIVQRHFLEMDEAEMVDQLHVPASTVKWWLHVARKNLRAFLEGDNHE